MKEIIVADGAPSPKVPISQAVKAGGFIFCSGAVPRDPVSGEMVEGDIEAQTEQVLKNLKNILETAGSSLEKTVKVTVFMAKKEEFPGMNRVFKRFLGTFRRPLVTLMVHLRALFEVKIS